MVFSRCTNLVIVQMEPRDMEAWHKHSPADTIYRNSSSSPLKPPPPLRHPPPLSWSRILYYDRSIAHSCKVTQTWSSFARCIQWFLHFDIYRNTLTHTQVTYVFSDSCTSIYIYIETHSLTQKSHTWYHYTERVIGTAFECHSSMGLLLPAAICQVN